MTRALVLAALVAAGCGASDPHGGDTPFPDGQSGDALPECMVYLTFDPPMAVASPTTQIRATANVLYASGVLAYTWTVTDGNNAVVATQAAQPDGSAVMFAGASAGVYSVTVRVDGAVPACADEVVPYNVLAPGANMKQYRLRVFPGAATAPPQEKLVLVNGGANATLGDVAIDPGIVANGQLPVPAYLRFIPIAARDAYVEVFTTAAGAYSARVLNAPHDVLVVPTAPGHAPQLVRNWTPGAALAPSAGAAIDGVVTLGATPIADAKVQITIDGVPSTLATTASDGTFRVLSIATPNVPATVDVTPPRAIGLPRITATSSAFAFGGPVQIRYGATTLRDLAGTAVQRGGTPLPGATVTVVGSVPAAATVTAGTTVTAAGIVRVAAVTNASGELPMLRAPAAQLGAAIAVGPTDVALAALDLRTAVPPSITAAAMQPRMTTLQLGTTPLPGAVVEVVPAGALALAGLPAARVVAGAGGVATFALAPGASYELRFSDPRTRAAPPEPALVTAATLASAYALEPAVRIGGTLQLQGNANPVAGAGVHVLCSACVGIARSRPLGEAASSSGGTFDVAVPDPGTL